MKCCRAIIQRHETENKNKNKKLQMYLNFSVINQRQNMYKTQVNSVVKRIAVALALSGELTFKERREVMEPFCRDDS